MLRGKGSPHRAAPPETLPSANFASKLANHDSAVARADRHATRSWNILETREIGRLRRILRSLENSRKSQPSRRFAATFTRFAIIADDGDGDGRMAVSQTGAAPVWGQSTTTMIVQDKDIARLFALATRSFEFESGAVTFDRAICWLTTMLERRRSFGNSCIFKPATRVFYPFSSRSVIRLRNYLSKRIIAKQREHS